MLILVSICSLKIGLSNATTHMSLLLSWAELYQVRHSAPQKAARHSALTDGTFQMNNVQSEYKGKWIYHQKM